MVAARLQTALSIIYPPRCLGCGDVVERDFGLCATCWRETPFIGGAICDACGAPLPGQGEVDIAHCDSCMETRPPWDRGRAALMYRDKARSLVLGLKHGDKQEIAVPAAGWMALASKEIIDENQLVVPIPLHWTRMLKRKYNQSVLLARALAERLDMAHCPDLLTRIRRTRSLNGLDPALRVETLSGAFQVTPKRAHRIAGGRPVLLVDDVMTSGATLTEACRVLQAAGAGPVSVVTLARTVKGA